MKRGQSGVVGGGIYFATSKEDTHRKAQQRGVVLTVDVRLGSVRTIDGGGSTTFAQLNRDGYDSVEVPWTNGTEYVVYNWDQELRQRRRQRRRSTSWRASWTNQLGAREVAA